MTLQKDDLNVTKKKKKQMQEISTHGYELSMRFLLCQDVIFHNIPTPLDVEIHRTPPRYIENWLAVYRQTNNLWIKGQPLEMEIGPRCN